MALPMSAESGDSSASSLDFDSNDSVDLGGLNVNGSGLTVASWFRAESFPGGARDPRIVSKASGAAANAHIFMLSTIRSGAETLLRARVRVGGVTRTLIADSGSLATGVWYHAALVYDQSTLKLYLNAQEVGSVALSGAVDQDSSVPVAIGSQPDGGGRIFDGNIDDVRILQRAYSEAELQAIVDGAQNPGPDVNSLPTANNDAYSFFNVVADQPIDIAAEFGVLTNDTDTDGDTLSAQLGESVSSGTLDLNEDGSFTYTPVAGFTGESTFTYFANDGTDNSETAATVTLTVEADPGEPELVAVADAYQTSDDTTLSVDAQNGVLANDTVTDTATAVLVDDVLTGVLTLNSDGSFTYEPVSGSDGVETFSYFLSDGPAESVVVDVTITIDGAVIGGPVAPVAMDDDYQLIEGNQLSVNAASGVLANDTDENEDALSAQLATDVSNGDLGLDEDGSLTYTPNVGFVGEDTFTYFANDGTDNSETAATVTLTVEADPDREIRSW